MTAGTSGKTKVHLDVFDPFHISLSRVRGSLGISADDDSVTVAPIDEHTARCDFRRAEWPAEALGDKSSAVEFRDYWKHPQFYHATIWLKTRSPSAFASLLEDNGDVYFVIEDYDGIVPSNLLMEVLRLGLQLEISPLTLVHPPPR